MASKTREDRIIRTVACPDCGAPAGELCRFNYRVKEVYVGRRLMVHSGRRRWWQTVMRTAGAALDHGHSR